jgi:Ni,Fe-hydrogenase III small subunit/formate hydrogenlyase subunit 6/NADH:ubiquinone oxidoreductase subunit I
MPLDLVRRLLTPLRDPVATSRYPEAAPLLQFATRGMPEIDPALCDGSGECAEACPTEAIELGISGAIRAIDAGRCIFCSACVIACPKGALSMGSRVELAAADRTELIKAAPPATSVRPLDGQVRRQVLSRMGRSLHVRHLDAGSCNGCDWECAALLNPYHDIQRLGIDFVASPRHADLLLVTGVMTRNLEEAARRTYEAMPEPRLVVAVGACAISGGVFAGSPEARDGIAGVVPVDVFVPGCPPRPEALIEALLKAIELGRASRPEVAAARPE